MTGLFHYIPTREMRRFQHEMDRLFASHFAPFHQGAKQTETTSWTPRVDLVENDDTYLIYLDIPGTSKDKLEINFHEDKLTVTGDREGFVKQNGEKALILERQNGHFQRTFTLPETVASDKIEASYQDGVLTIRVPKAEKTRPQKIEVS